MKALLFTQKAAVGLTITGINSQAGLGNPCRFEPAGIASWLPTLRFFSFQNNLCTRRTTVLREPLQ
jgi:hypothetical protein